MFKNWRISSISGALLALPILSVLRETALYLNRHLTFEAWEHTPRGLL